MFDDLSYRLGNLRKHLALYKAEGYNTITCNELFMHWETGFPLPPKPLLITFDHGFRTYFDFVANALIECELIATFFINGEWALRSSFRQSPYFETYMDAELLRQMASYGFELGLHPYGCYDTKESSLNDLQADVKNGMLFFDRFSISYTKALAFPYKWKPFRTIRSGAISSELDQLGIRLSFCDTGTRTSQYYKMRHKLARTFVDEELPGGQLLDILRRQQSKSRF